MTTVGIRDLKAHLSACIRRVRRGETVRVTDRGVVVAQICPPEVEPEVPPELAGFAALAKLGLVRLGKSNKGVKYPKSPVRLADGTAQATLDAEREDRV